MPSDLDRAIQKLAEKDWTEDSKVTVVVEQPRPPAPTLPDSDPPRGGISFKSEKWSFRHVPPWVLVALGAIAAGAWAWVKTR